MTEESQLFFDLGLPPREAMGRDAEYDRHRKQAARRQTEVSAEGRDIGSIPLVADPERREACRQSLELFCSTYFPDKFYLGFSGIQREMMGRIQASAIHGGMFAIAMPRGSGKTTICECAAIWSALYGYRRFVVVIGSTDGAAHEIYDTIRMAFEANELLQADFPEVCYPVSCLEGITNRCKGQLCCGKRTYLEWGDSKMVFPTVEGSFIGGNIITATSLTGRIRGMKHTTSSGAQLRPDFAIIDDPQTFESAKSVTQTADRLKIINSDILGLAGPGKKLTVVMPCTVIVPNDLADQLLDRDLNPEWRGKRFQLLDGFPKNMVLWQRYWEIRSQGQREDKGTDEATLFYISHKKEMDEGCAPSWPERFFEDEVSAIQNAMNLYFSNKQMFLSEYQNNPEGIELGEGEQVTMAEALHKLNGRPKEEIPQAASHLTMFVDVQKNLLYWVVMAFSDDFTGWVIDYGAYPDQPLSIFTTKDAKPTYRDMTPGAGMEGALTAALHTFLVPKVTGCYLREDGMEMSIERCMIDAGWGDSSDIIYNFIKESRLGAIIMPSKGVGITATVRPFSEYQRKLGEIISDYEWQISPIKNKRWVRLMRYDTNWWKSFFRNRFFMARGESSSFSVNGTEATDRFRMLCDHLSSEYSTPESSKGRRVDIWKMYPNRENHWLDCVIGCMVAASERGCRLLIAPPTAAGREAVRAPSPRGTGPHRPPVPSSPRKSYEITKTYTVG